MLYYLQSILYLQYIVVCMFLQYIDLWKCEILQCTVKFYMHLLYIITIRFKFSKGWLVDCLPVFLL